MPPIQNTTPSLALIVDDQASMRRALRDLLNMSFPAARVVEAANGAAAVELFTGARPKLVLMDVCLPDAGGIDLARQVKTLAPETVVVVVSIDKSARTRALALAAGAAAFIAKDRLYEELTPLLQGLSRLEAGTP